MTNLISNIFPLDKIPDFLKRAFLLDDSIYSDNYYFKGIFPKIIVSTSGENEYNIKGLCSFYYENNENLNEVLTIRINSIFAIEDYEKQIEMMLDFIKKNVKFDKIEVYLLYDKIENKFVPNDEAKKLFQNSKFKWLCVVRDEKLQQRYIKLYYNNKNQNKEENIEENNNNENINRNNFLMDNLTIISVINDNKAEILKNIINNKSNDIILYKPNYNKFINPNSIYSLIIQNSSFKEEFMNEEIKSELMETKEKLFRFVTIEYGWNTLPDEKKKIKKLNIDLKKTVFKEVENYLMKNEECNCLCDFYKTDLSINFESNYSILIDNIYYNRISSDKIKILKEKKTNSKFFLIPSNDNTVLFYFAQINKNLHELLIDTNKNIYEEFLEFQPSTQKEIFDFSMTSYRDISYIPQTFKKSSKTIYIPTFKINTHLFSYDFKDINKKVKLSDIETNNKCHLASVDEFLNIEFKPDENINNCFSVIPVEGRMNDIIIKDSFIIGIFDNDIINNKKLPLMQFLYISKDNFLTKSNYNSEGENKND